MNNGQTIPARIATNWRFVLSLTVFTFGFFKLFPNIDIYVSQLFYNGKFIGAHHKGVRFLHDTSWMVTILLYFVPIFFWPILKKAKETKRAFAYLLSYALGPGILVNLILKAHWGRPRPNQVEIFGGCTPFVSVPFFPTGLGGHYPSYVSGHGALAFFVTMVGIFIDPQRRDFWFWLGFIYWVIIVLVRLSEGGHFLSDLILAACYVWLFSLIIYYQFFRR